MPGIPSVSVIVVAKNAAATIKKCLRSILASSLPGSEYEVLVIDDHSTDDTIAIVRDNFPSVKLFSNPKTGPSAARNYGVQLARTPYIAFTDSDCIVENKWLEALLDAIRQGPYASVGGVQDAPDDESAFGMKINALYEKIGPLTDYLKKEQSDPIIRVSHNPSCCVIYRRDIFIRENGFLEDFYPGEDLEFDYLLTRKGYQLVFTSQAKVQHYRGNSLKGFLRKMQVYGYTQGRLARTYGFFRKIHWLAFLNVCVGTGFILLGITNFWAVLFLFAAGSFFGLFFFSFDFQVFFLAVTGLSWWQAGFLCGLTKKLPWRSSAK